MNDDLISRQAAIDIVNKYDKSHMVLKGKPMLGAAPIVIELEDLPSAEPHLEEFEWCTDCKEYDQKNHCCHRFTKVIRQTVEELKSQPQRMRGRWMEHYSHEDGERDGVECSECRTHFYFGGQLMNFCPNCGADMREGQDG